MAIGDDNTRSWLGAMLTFLDRERPEDGGDAPWRGRTEPPRRVWVVERALERRAAARSQAVEQIDDAAHAADGAHWTR